MEKTLLLSNVRVPVDLKNECVMYWVEGDEILIFDPFDKSVNVYRGEDSKFPMKPTSYITEKGTFVYLGGC